MLDVAGLQARLAGEGVDPGPPDGVLGARTWRALLDFAAARALGATGDALAGAAAAHAADHGLTTALRLAHFLAQIVHETGGFRRFEEDLCYSAAALRRVWPARFPPDRAARCAGDPAAIAEIAYGGRMGNDRPGDGWLYRGRGCLHLTGRANYAACGARLGLDLEARPERAADAAVSLLVALDFWSAARVNAAADADDLPRARRLTNGGAIGIADVARLLARMKRVLV